ncbi:MAG: ABC transporter substrate-binding protein [Propionibacteriales bacterium]|nr:ABC transporter substrate-binding protein [Propionibacteriales bacterium]
MKSLTTRLAAVAAATVTALALGACSSGPGTTSQPEDGGSGEVQLINAGQLTVCTHLPYAPFEANDDSGQPVGFDIDLMNLVAKKLNAEVAVVDTPFEGIKSGQDMATSKCDIAAAGMTITEERQKAILFSDPYFDATQALLVPTGGVTDLSSLKGKKLGAQSATTGLDYAKENADKNGYSIVEYQDVASETQALLSGQVDGAINDLPVWSEVLKQNPGKLEVSAQFDTGEQYGFGMKLGNDALKKVVDETLTTAKSDGSYDAAYKKWIGEVPK